MHGCYPYKIHDPESRLGPATGIRCVCDDTLPASRRPEVGDRGDAGEEPCHGLAPGTPGDKDQPRSPVLVRPVFELDRRMGDMLDEVDDDRPAALGECDEA